MSQKAPYTAQQVFQIKDTHQFNEIALKLFRWQAENNTTYKTYLEHLQITPAHIKRVEDIPFLPIQLFKTHGVTTGAFKPEAVFTSSGTTGATTSSHYVKDIAIYEHSFTKGFEHFYGAIDQYCILALLPSYLERQGSSLVYMAKALIEQSQHPKSGFYLRQYDELVSTLAILNDHHQPTILLGVTYALLDIAEQYDLQLPHTIIMETGGMKGQRKEMIREALHHTLKEGFGVSTIHSEYGMTELLSQAYSKGNGKFTCPPWMQVSTRQPNDPFALVKNGGTGGLNVIDLANLYSCAFIATQDLGKVFSDGTFEVLGRFDHSDLRGCNLLFS